MTYRQFPNTECVIINLLVTTQTIPFDVSVNWWNYAAEMYSFFVVCWLVLSSDSVQFSSVQFKMIFMHSKKVHVIVVRSTPSLGCFPDVAFETVSVFV